CGSQLVVLAPPYRNPTSLATLERGAALPLGSLVFGDGDATIAVLAELTALSYRAPWAVPCLALPAQQQPLEPLLLLVTELRDRLVVVHRSVARRVDDWAQIVRCVRRRTVCEYTRKYLAMPYHLVAERLGWEWVLEAALRTARYVAPERRRGAHRPSGPVRQQILHSERARVSS